MNIFQIIVFERKMTGAGGSATSLHSSEMKLQEVRVDLHCEYQFET